MYVFTDSVCRDNQVWSLWRASIAGIWADGHALNLVLPLGDGDQTNNRAELAAVNKVLELEQRPVEIRADGKHVLDSVLQHR